jgi:hypothetical protein
MDGLKFVVANYNIPTTSVWIVPKEWNDKDIWVKYDTLHYKDHIITGKQAQNPEECLKNYTWKYPTYDLEICDKYDDAVDIACRDGGGFQTDKDDMTEDWLKEYICKLPID